MACSQKNANIHKSSVAPLKPIPVNPQCFWRIHIDMTGKLSVRCPKSNEFMIIAVCAFLKYVESAGNKRSH